MSTAQRAAPTATTAAAPAIPFRKTPVASGPEVFGLLLTTLLVLASFAGLAWYARRRGWLDRWITAAPAPGAGNGNRKLAVLERLALSRRTTVYRVSDGEREFLVTESLVQVQTNFDSPVAKP